MVDTNMENVLQYINRNFVTVADGDIKESNLILSNVLNEITSALKSVNVLFNHMFETCLYGGSSYDGLKVSKPDEFNIDLKLLLPKILDIQIEQSDKNGFVYIKLKDWNKFSSNPSSYLILRDLESLKDAENYLSQVKVKQWTQGIVAKAINKIREQGSLDEIKIKQSVNGPAIKLNVTHNYCNMNIDLVIVFRIPGDKWPAFPVRQNTNKIWKDFLVVPKPPKNVRFNEQRYWRLSFPEQEREMIKGLNYCKPAIRLLKKLRDTRTHNIPSYFIKTVFLWEIKKREENYDPAFWNTSLTNVFLQMLKIYKKYLENHEIPYFWSENNNLLQHIEQNNITNIKNYLERMIKKIDINMDSNPYIIAEFLLPPEELQKLKSHFAGTVSVRDSETGDGWMREPVAYAVEDDSRLQTRQNTDTSSSLWAGAAALGIGAAVVGLFAYARDQRNQNN